MKLLLELSMECESLARAEALSAARALGKDPLILGEDRGVLIIDTSANPRELASRLGLCHFVDEWLGTCGFDDLERTAGSLSVEGPIRVHSTKVGDIHIDLAGKSRKLGKIIGETRGVNLHEPKSDIRAVFSGKAHVGKVLAAIDRTAFENRKNRYMPFVYPASLHPKFARAMVNLTEVPGGDKLLDPFCGTGAIVAEASLVGLSAFGTDFSEKMIAGADLNLRYLGLRARTQVCDVGEISERVGHVEGIATDPPYGRSTSTKGESIAALYKRAFRAFSDVLDSGDKVVVAVPEIGLVQESPHFRVLDTHSLWVHRSLTRNFCVMEKV